MDREHLQAQPALQTHHLHSRLYTHNNNPGSLHPHITHHQNPKTNVNLPTQPPISDEEQQHVPKSTNGSQVKCSKQQPRQQEERLCFYCNQPGHLKRNCPEIPYCSKCRTRGHAPDRCTSKPQWNGHTHQTGESRDQRRKNKDLPQFSSHHNRCLHCAGDHQTTNCTTTRQWQTPTTNSPASGTGTSIHQNAPNTSHSSSHPNSQSPASCLLYMCKHQPLTLTLHNFNLTYIQLLPHHLHKITKALIITQINNKCTHHQHNHLMHSFHNLSTPMFHHHIFHNIHLLTVHLHIVLILRSC